jgi:hypothetical protein
MDPPLPAGELSVGNAFTAWAWGKVAPIHQALATQRAGRPSLNGDAAPAAPAGEASAPGELDPADIPVLINSFNQPTYLRTMMGQLQALGCRRIIVLDQASTYAPLLDYLGEIEDAATVIRLRENHGPHWLFTSGLSLSLPDFFIYTDPDIVFPPDMPATVIADLLRAAVALDATKVGLALDISRPEAMKRANITIGGAQYTFATWEQQFWAEPVAVEELELYRAPVDTTFALYNRRRFDPLAEVFREQKLFDCMDTPGSYRLAGRYTSVHAPWMLDDPMPQEEHDFYCAHRANFHDY